MLKNYIMLLRPSQYVKNVFIFMPLFFAGKISSLNLLNDTILAFMAFSIAASGIYILNDLCDIKEDRLHPKKKQRAIAAGLIKKRTALIVMLILFVIGISCMYELSLNAFHILCIYIFLNIMYSFYLKRIAILDVTTISIGFVLRLFIGAGITETPLSMWIVIMTFLIALFMALAKRRDDVLLFLKTGQKMRSVIGGYNLKFIDGAMIIMALAVIVTYTLYTTSSEVLLRMDSPYLYLTTLFIILGVMRYLQLAFVENDSSSPTEIVYKDRFVQVTIFAWLLSFVGILYL